MVNIDAHCYLENKIRMPHMLSQIYSKVVYFIDLWPQILFGYVRKDDSMKHINYKVTLRYFRSTENGIITVELWEPFSIQSPCREVYCVWVKTSTIEMWLVNYILLRTMKRSCSQLLLGPHLLVLIFYGWPGAKAVCLLNLYGRQGYWKCFVYHTVKNFWPLNHDIASI